MYYSLGAARGTQSNGPGAPPRSRRTRPEPFLADAGSGPGNCAGMEETTGAPSSFAALSPRRLRASSRDGGGVVNRPPSPLTMLLSRHTRRREVIAGMAGAVAAWPLGAQGQQRAIPRLCFLTFDAGTLRTRSSRFDAFFQGLHDLGYEDGRTIDIRYLSADNNDDRFPTLIDECLSLKPAVIAVTTTPAAHLLKKATSTIPIVMMALGDPLGTGLVDNLSHPSGNITGMSSMVPELAVKRLELLRELVPGISRVL